MSVVVKRLRFLATIAAALGFMAMFAAFILQIFTRYVLNDPTAWTQEATLISYVWVVFWCAAFLTRDKDQITFDMVVLASPRRVQRWLAFVCALVTLGAFLAALPATVDWISFMRIEKTPVLGLRYDILYSIFIVFVVCVVIRQGLRVARLLSRRWGEVLDDRPSGFSE